MKKTKLLRKISDSPKNTSFSDLSSLITAFGFTLARTSGSHHIYYHPDITELVNIQNVRGMAKPYQIKQFLKIVEKYNLKLRDE
ncbi:MAG: type II toxin-antitoxin system HicA family toxin [Tunicatimonas sp.]